MTKDESQLDEESVNDNDNLDDSLADDAVIAGALRWSLVVMSAVVLLVALTVGIYWLTRPKMVQFQTKLQLPEIRDATSIELPRIPMTDIAKAAGVNWQHYHGMEGEKLLPETMGGAVAVLDYDQDGDQDLIFASGDDWPWSKRKSSETRPSTLSLYENNGSASFTLKTRECGLADSFYAMGLATGDYDNDGWCDLFVTAVGKNRLYKNDHGKFVDVTDMAGVGGASDAWSTSACWLDFDNDGLLDLFVCNYVVWSRELDLSLGSTLTGIGRAFGQPTNFSGTFCYLYRNLGKGEFQDESEQAGIQVRNANTHVAVGKALGVVAVDVNRDGWQDLIVANDTVQNFLFVNLQNGKFDEAGIPSGIAFDRSGNATGAMGIDASWARNDDCLAVVIGNFANEPASLYISRGTQTNFFDAAMASGIGPMTKLSLTFGMFFCDLDLDGRQDIVCANGHLEADISKVQPNQQYAHASQFFWNAGLQGSTEFLRLGDQQLGTAALQPVVGRGSAYGDLDNDGDLDLVMVANGQAPLLLRNDQQTGHHFLRVKLQGTQANRDGIGAIIRVSCGGITQTRSVTTGRSYLSASELPQTFGLADFDKIGSLEIEWPGGQRQQVTAVEIDKLIVIKQSSP